MAVEKRLGNADFPPLTKSLNVNDDIIGPHMEGIERGISTLGNAQANVGTSRKRLQATADNPNNKEETREKARKSLGVLADMEEGGHIPSEPLTLELATQRVQEHTDRSIQEARDRSALTGKQVPMEGAGWYFKHHGTSIEPSSHLSADTQSAMSSVASAGKTPEDERVSMHAARDLLDPSKNHTVTINKKTAAVIGGGGIVEAGTHNVRDLSPTQLSHIAVHASTENAAIEAGERSKRTRGISSTGDIVGLGRVHQPNVEAQGDIAGLEDPWDYFDPATRPKTLAYGKNIAEARKVGRTQSAEELDYLGIAQHLVHGDPNQGMLMFSRTDPTKDYEQLEDGSPSIFSPERDTPQDQWMQAIRSGAPNFATRQITNKRGIVSTRGYSPSKRIVDSSMPGGIDNINKSDMGLPDDPRVTVEGVAHAFGDESVKAVARAFGPISHDQFGKAIRVPSLLVQETSWSRGRNEALGNDEYNAELRQWNKDVAAEDKATAKRTKQDEKRRNSNSYKDTEGNTVSQMFVGDSLAVNNSALPPKRYR